MFYNETFFPGFQKELTQIQASLPSLCDEVDRAQRILEEALTRMELLKHGVDARLGDVVLFQGRDARRRIRARVVGVDETGALLVRTIQKFAGESLRPRRVTGPGMVFSLEAGEHSPKLQKVDNQERSAISWVAVYQSGIHLIQRIHLVLGRKVLEAAGLSCGDQVIVREGENAMEVAISLWRAGDPFELDYPPSRIHPRNKSLDFIVQVHVPASEPIRRPLCPVSWRVEAPGKLVLEDVDLPLPLKRKPRPGRRGFCLPEVRKKLGLTSTHQG